MAQGGSSPLLDVFEEDGYDQSPDPGDRGRRRLLLVAAGVGVGMFLLIGSLGVASQGGQESDGETFSASEGLASVGLDGQGSSSGVNNAAVEEDGDAAPAGGLGLPIEAANRPQVFVNGTVVEGQELEQAGSTTSAGNADDTEAAEDTANAENAANADAANDEDDGSSTTVTTAQRAPIVVSTETSTGNNTAAPNRRTTTEAPSTTRAPATTVAPTTTRAPTTRPPTTRPPTTRPPTTRPPTTQAPTTRPPTTAPPSGNTCNSNGEFERVFRDDFNGSSLSNSWRQYNSSGNRNFGLRRPSANSVSNGNLNITAKMENNTLVSGGLSLKLDMTYGKYVFRVRTDNDPSQAVSGVILTWPQAGNNYRNGENNMYETLVKTPNRNPFFTFIHKPFGTASTQESYKHNADGSQWQTMGMEWTPNRITITRQGPGASSSDSWTVNETSANLIPDVPHHLAIQLDGWKHSIGAPVKMQVDFVEVYKYCG